MNDVKKENITFGKKLKNKHHNSTTELNIQ